jgi:hypothetical protein
MSRLVLLMLVAGAVACGRSAPTSASDTCAALSATTYIFVQPGETLRVNFTVPPTTGTDMLSVEMAYIANPLAGTPAVSCRLYDGDALLATGGCGAWQSVTAAFPRTGIPLIDFSSIARGTSAGRIEFAVAAGSILFELDGNISVSRTTGPSPTDISSVASGTLTSFALVSGSCR